MASKTPCECSDFAGLGPVSRPSFPPRLCASVGESQEILHLPPTGGESWITQRLAREIRGSAKQIARRSLTGRRPRHIQTSRSATGLHSRWFVTVAVRWASISQNWKNKSDLQRVKETEWRVCMSQEEVKRKRKLFRIGGQRLRPRSLVLWKRGDIWLTEDSLWVSGKAARGAFPSDRLRVDVPKRLDVGDAKFNLVRKKKKVSRLFKQELRYLHRRANNRTWIAFLLLHLWADLCPDVFGSI